MRDVEILIVESSGTDNASQAAKTAGKLQKHLLRLDGTVRRVTSLDNDVQVVADEVTAALRRAPSLLALVGGTGGEASPAGLAAATERELVHGIPDGATSLDADARCLVMLVAGTLVVVVPRETVDFDSIWGQELGDALAEWFGHPPHAKGELIVLGAGPQVVEQLFKSVLSAHPAVNLKQTSQQPAGGGIKVTALACGHSQGAQRDVDAVLFDLERAAAIARLQVSSTGRMAAHDAGRGT